MSTKFNFKMEHFKNASLVGNCFSCSQKDFDHNFHPKNDPISHFFHCFAPKKSLYRIWQVCAITLRPLDYVSLKITQV